MPGIEEMNTKQIEISDSACNKRKAMLLGGRRDTGVHRTKRATTYPCPCHHATPGAGDRGIDGKDAHTEALRHLLHQPPERAAQRR